MKEWPLVFFTLAIQLACGLTLAATVVDAEPVRPLAMAIFPLVALGIAVSAAHLGRPFAFWRALRNFRQSPLSREIAVTALFTVLALAYSAFWATGKVEGRFILGVVTSVAGIAAVIASALVYTVPAQPAWNSAWVPVSFLGTSVLLGGAAGAGASPVFSAAIVLGSLLILFSAGWMLPRLPRSWTWKNSVSFGCHVVLVSTVPVAAAFGSLPSAAVLSAAVLGAAIGRSLMYSVAREPF
jgi:DMSO reductase anchor subunit